MRVIFLSDVPGSGRAGEVKEVKSGYARNFLLPRKLAAAATHDQLQRIELIRKAAEERRLKEEQDMRALADQLGQLTINLKARVGPTGKFYGAVTSAQIAEELARITDREIDRRTVILAEPIQEPGAYQVEVRLPLGVTATLKLAVEGLGVEGVVVAATQAAEAPPPAEGVEAPQADAKADQGSQEPE